ncbi:MAG: trigger factor [Bacteroidota bacterium]
MGTLVGEFCFIHQQNDALEIQYNPLSDQMATIQIRLSPEDYKDQVLSSIKKQGKNAQLPGFRPGKIPVSMLKKMVGKPVMIEEINRLLQDSLNSYVEKEEIDLLGSPLPTESKSEEYFDLALDKELDFAFEIGLSPSFELQLDKLIDIEEYQIEIDEEYLNQEIENSRERYGKVDNPESVEKGDIIFGKLEEVDAEGNPVEEGFEKMIVLNPTRIDAPEKLDQFEGKELEFSLPFSMDWYSEDPKKAAELMFLSPEEVEALEGKNLHFTLKRINRVAPAELNDEFYRQALGPNYPEPEVEVIEEVTPEPEETEPVETPESPESSEAPEEETEQSDTAEAEAPPTTELEEATFREKFAELIKMDWDRELGNEINYRIRDKVLEIHEVELPEAYLRNLYKAEQKEPLTEEQLVEAYPNYERAMKWTLIVDKIYKNEEGLEVTKEDIDEGIIEMYAPYYPNMSEEDAVALVQHAAQNQDTIRQVSVRKMEEKIYNFLKEQATLVPTPITVTEFLEKNKENEE